MKVETAWPQGLVSVMNFDVFSLLQDQQCIRAFPEGMFQVVNAVKITVNTYVVRSIIVGGGR